MQYLHGHRGYATVHSDSSTNTIDRLVTLMKRDVNSQSYTDKYLRKLLSMSIDLIIFMKKFKVHEIAEVIYDEEKNDVNYNILFEFEVERYENGKSIGHFIKVNDPIGKCKEKIELNEFEIERILA